MTERKLRRGFAEKLESRKINKVWRQIAGKWELIWERIDGVWTPVHADTTYDDKEN